MRAGPVAAARAHSAAAIAACDGDDGVSDGGPTSGSTGFGRGGTPPSWAPAWAPARSCWLACDTAVTRLGLAGVVEARIWARVSGMSSRLASPESSWSVNSRSRVRRAIAIVLAAIAAAACGGDDRTLAGITYDDPPQVDAVALPEVSADGAPFEFRAPAVIVASGGIGANHDLVRQNWPKRMGRVPEQLLSGVPAHVDGRMIGITESAGGHVINSDRMWHYTEGITNYDPIWPLHGIRILPGPSSLWLDATGNRKGEVHALSSRPRLMSTATPPGTTAIDSVEWHTLDAADTATRLAVDVAEGLDASETASRLAEYGPNQLAVEPPPRRKAR